MRRREQIKRKKVARVNGVRGFIESRNSSSADGVATLADALILYRKKRNAPARDRDDYFLYLNQFRIMMGCEWEKIVGKIGKSWKSSDFGFWNRRASNNGHVSHIIICNPRIRGAAGSNIYNIPARNSSSTFVHPLPRPLNLCLPLYSRPRP